MASILKCWPLHEGKITPAAEGDLYFACSQQIQHLDRRLVGRRLDQVRNGVVTLIVVRIEDVASFRG
jgi:hypothetical protein